jgi:hypothetical protein
LSTQQPPPSRSSTPQLRSHPSTREQTPRLCSSVLRPDSSPESRLEFFFLPPFPSRCCRGAPERSSVRVLARIYIVPGARARQSQGGARATDSCSTESWGVTLHCATVNDRWSSDERRHRHNPGRTLRQRLRHRRQRPAPSTQTDGCTARSHTSPNTPTSTTSSRPSLQGPADTGARIGSDMEVHGQRPRQER